MRDGPVGVEADLQATLSPAEVRHAGKSSPRNSANLPHRHPVFREVDYLAGLKKGVGFLVTEQAGLHFEIGAVIVGESFAPILGVCIDAPGPDLLGWKLLVIGKMDCPSICMRIPNPHEIFPASIAEHRDRSLGLIANHAVVHTILIHWPRMNLGEAVGGGEPHGIRDLRIIPRFHASIVPPVKAMSHIAAVTKSHALLEDGRFRVQHQLHRPFHSVDTVDVAYAYGCTPIVMLGKSKVNW